MGDHFCAAMTIGYDLRAAYRAFFLCRNSSDKSVNVVVIASLNNQRTNLTFLEVKERYDKIFYRNSAFLPSVDDSL